MGSSPATRTTFPKEFDRAGNLAQISHNLSPDRDRDDDAPPPEHRFPMKVRHRGASATIYPKTARYPFYRVLFRADGKRVVRNFKTYAEAKKAAKGKAREL